MPGSLDSLFVTGEEDLLFSDFDSLVKKYEDPDRVNWQSPELVLEKMGNIQNKIIADIGVGTGYFAFRMINYGAQVIGIDIDQRFLDYIEERKAELPREISSRLSTRLTVPDDPSLYEKEVDWIIIVNTYHYLLKRPEYLKKLFRGLKSGGHIIIVDFEIGTLTSGPLESQKVSSSKAVKEISNAGFKIKEIDKKTLQYQYIILAQRP